MRRWRRSGGQGRIPSLFEATARTSASSRERELSSRRGAPNNPQSCEARHRLRGPSRALLPAHHLFPGVEDGMSGFDNYLISGGLVAIFGWSRFNTPKTNRASTTLAQFYLTGFAYVASCLVLYLLVSRLIAENPSTLSFLGFEAGGSSEVASLSAPLLAALLMTTLLPSVPILQRIDRWLLEFFQRLGSIPQEVKRLSNQILSAELALTSRGQQAFQRELDDAIGFPD